mgnify:CR=1 FL=1
MLGSLFLIRRMLKKAVQRGRTGRAQNDERGTLKEKGFLLIVHRSALPGGPTYSASD